MHANMVSSTNYVTLEVGEGFNQFLLHYGFTWAKPCKLSWEGEGFESPKLKLRNTWTKSNTICIPLKIIILKFFFIKCFQSFVQILPKLSHSFRLIYLELGFHMNFLRGRGNNSEMNDSKLLNTNVSTNYLSCFNQITC